VPYQVSSDSEKFERLYSGTLRFAKGFARRLGLPTESGEDCHHDVFSNLWPSLYRLDRCDERYVFKAIRNRLISARNKRRRFEHLEESDSSESLSENSRAQGLSPFEDFEKRRHIEQVVRRIFQAANSTESGDFQLYVNGLSISQIAERRGVKPMAIYQEFWRFGERFRRTYQIGG
jgi:RNA polymerase sigma factor (sigma-70 family)